MAIARAWSGSLTTRSWLSSDLYGGGNQQEILKRAATLVSAEVQFIALLALNDDEAPSYDHGVAAAFAGFGIPSFARTPDLFPELMAAAIHRQVSRSGRRARDRDITRRQVKEQGIAHHCFQGGSYPIFTSASQWAMGNVIRRHITFSQFGSE